VSRIGCTARPTPIASGGREAGNAVVIRHRDGWETQYTHLKRGSVRVAPDDRVTRGQALGAVGLSGCTVFLHAEFSVLRTGRALDPFTGRSIW
jgi:murein DD-endopeptidase MepM/ murein hydrolase activator NlpD